MAVASTMLTVPMVARRLSRLCGPTVAAGCDHGGAIAPARLKGS
jgi:hypothetical protein